MGGTGLTQKSQGLSVSSGLFFFFLVSYNIQKLILEGLPVENLFKSLGAKALHELQKEGSLLMFQGVCQHALNVSGCVSLPLTLPLVECPVA